MLFNLWCIDNVLEYLTMFIFNQIMVFFMSLRAAIVAPLFFTVTLIFAANAYSAEKKEFYEITSEGQTITVPGKHLAPIYNVSRQGVWIYMFYPEFRPLDIQKPELQTQMAEGKIIDFVLNRTSQYKPREEALGMELKKNKADLKSGEEFGLTIYKQSNEKQASRPDIWVENETEPSFIVCNEPLDIKDSTCSHYLYMDGFYTIIFYPKNQLENWRTIKSKVLELYQSYKDFKPEEEDPPAEQ